jgi:signal transduction histidine kinase
MNNVISQMPLEAATSPKDHLEDREAGVYLRSIDDLAHALRQPLGTIESLAYYLELTTEDDQICRHLRQIRLMVDRASRILEDAGA